MFFGFIRECWCNTTVSKVLGAVALAMTVIVPQAAEAKTPGKTYCFNGVCHRVKTLQETAELIGKDQKFKTSFYDDCKRDRFNPCGLTSSGEVFRPRDADNAASPIYPNGTVLLLRNPNNGQAAVVRVNNAGPYWGKRMLDVSRGTAEKLGFKRRGVANLEVRIVYAPTKAEARYQKRRRYEAVPGPIGRFASLSAAGGYTMIAMNKSAPRSASLIAAAAGLELDQASATKSWKVASAEKLPSLVTNPEEELSGPAAALKAEALRELGKGTGDKRFEAPTATAGIPPILRSRRQVALNIVAPILRSRQQYTIE